MMSCHQLQCSHWFLRLTMQRVPQTCNQQFYYLVSCCANMHTKQCLEQCCALVTNRLPGHSHGSSSFFSDLQQHLGSTCMCLYYTHYMYSYISMNNFSQFCTPALLKVCYLRNRILQIVIIVQQPCKSVSFYGKEYLITQTINSLHVQYYLLSRSLSLFCSDPSACQIDLISCSLHQELIHRFHLQRNEPQTKNRVTIAMGPSFKVESYPLQDGYSRRSPPVWLSCASQGELSLQISNIPSVHVYRKMQQCMVRK